MKRPAFLAFLLLTCAVLLAWQKPAQTEEGQHRGVQLRVCADPNNLPFSNDRLEGFENKIAELIAHDLSATVRYTWWPQRRAFIRNTLGAGACDLVIGIPTGSDKVLTTLPYYRSTYVFIQRASRVPRIKTFNAPELKKLVIGVQLIGDDYANTPPAHALAIRGIVSNVRGYQVTGNYSQANPPARIVEAVARGEIDIAIAWGAMAGYFAALQKPPLIVTPVEPQQDGPLPFSFDISAGVRRGNVALKGQVDEILKRRKRALDAILDAYHVPRNTILN